MLKWALGVDMIEPSDAANVYREHKDVFCKLWDTTNIGELMTPWDMVKEIEQERKQLWLVHGSGIIQALVITSVQIYPKTSVFDVEGLMSYERVPLDWDRMLNEQMLPWAYNAGCQYCYVNGRRGWLRALDGYDEVGCVVRKRI